MEDQNQTESYKHRIKEIKKKIQNPDYLKRTIQQLAVDLTREYYLHIKQH